MAKVISNASEQADYQGTRNEGNKTLSSVEKVKFDDVDYALIVRAPFRAEGVTFLTPDTYSQQLGYMQHSRGKKILAHSHNLQPRTVHSTQEVLVIRSGQLRVDFYRPTGDYLESRLLSGGDVILLIQGGHGFEVIEDVEMIEIKQGPYVGTDDKSYLPNVQTSQVRIPE